MNCMICGAKLADFDEVIKDHLLVLNGDKGHIHVHGPQEKKDVLNRFMQEIKERMEIGDVVTEKKSTVPSEVIFHNRQRIGDILVFTCGVRDFKKAYPNTKVNVISTASHIWDHNPNIDRSIVPYYKNGKTLESITVDDLGINTNVLKIGPGRLTSASNRLDWHFANAFRVSIEDALKINIPQGISRPDIWMTREEYEAPPITKEPYWIIITNGEKGWGCKMYPFERWQAFVSQNPDTLFYQLGTKGDDAPRLQGKNVVDYIGKTEDKTTGVRDLFKLFLNAEGSIGLVSFHMHLSGGLWKPSIVVAGAREPVSFTRYPGHQYLSTDGVMPCATNTACWHCNIDTCVALVQRNEKIPLCVDMISPEDLTKALNAYYIGGRLKKGVRAPKPKQFTNIVNTPVAIPVPIAVPKSNTDITKYGMAWGGGCITDKDWDFIQETIKKRDVKTVLEFGCGLSTLLMHDAGVVVDTYETMQGWIDKLKAKNKDLNIKLWDGKTENMVEEKQYDMAFVDGPSGGASREISTKIAAQLAKVVIIHDAGRANEKMWQEKYIVGNFHGPIRGGHRCFGWTKERSGTCLSKIQ